MAEPRPGRVGLIRVEGLFGLNAREWRLASTSAVLLFAAFPPFHLMAPSFLALVPLTLAVRGARTPRRAARIGFAFGLPHYGLLLHWMVPALGRSTVAAPLIFATAVVLLALSQALVCWMLGFLGRTGRIPLWCALPLVWTAAEWGVAHAPGTLAYPWLGLGTSLTGYPELAGIAEVVGARGVTLWLALVNGLVAEGWCARDGVRRARSAAADGRPAGGSANGSGRRWSRFVRGVRGGFGPARPWFAAALAVAVVPAAWGVWRARNLEPRPGPVVAAVRTTLRAAPGEEITDLEALAAVDSLLSAVGSGAPPPSLVVLPEGTFRDGLDQPDVVAGLADLSRRVMAPVLFGVVRPAESGAGRYNSAVLAGPDGLLGDPYDKRRLVPWVERVPLSGAFPLGEEGLLRPGQEWTVFDAGGYRIGTLICYEAAFAGAARALGRGGARVLLNITNDAWFGRAGSLAVAQHEAHLVMRAIETRTGVVRSANFGPVGFVDPTGRVRARTSAPGAAVMTARVDALAEPTGYVRVGDVAGPGAATAVLLLLLFVRSRRSLPQTDGRPETGCPDPCH